MVDYQDYISHIISLSRIQKSETLLSLMRLMIKEKEFFLKGEKKRHCINSNEGIKWSFKSIDLKSQGDLF